MITYRFFTPAAGSDQISHTSLRRVRILEVDREGNGNKIISGVLVPTNDEVAYLGIGRLKFDANNPFNSGEKVYVLYET
jgi:23S rRNA C2498 (ribose-2'-O)-methylase RlmM